MSAGLPIREQVYWAQMVAMSAHRGQFRRDGVTPYIEHCGEVARRVVAMMGGGPEDTAAAEMVAWLHDTLEDTELTSAWLRRERCPECVVVAVEAMTKGSGESYEGYLARVAGNTLARKVKVADMLANLGDAPTEAQIVRYAGGLLFLLGSGSQEEGLKLLRAAIKKPCRFCGYEFNEDEMGVHGCPNCHGEGLEK